MSDDLSWAAGLFEGEGFTVRRKVGRRVYLQLGIETTDRDVLERFVGIMRSNGVAPEERDSGPRKQSEITTRRRNVRNPKHKDIYRWVTTGNTARTAYELLRPNLASRRRMKADQILAESDEIISGIETTGTCEECGREFTMARYSHSKRFCSERCRNLTRARTPGFRLAANERNRRHKLRLRLRHVHPDQLKIH